VTGGRRLFYNGKVVPVICFWLMAGRVFFQEESNAKSETPSLEASYVHAPGA
jgi:hypothetical protein